MSTETPKFILNHLEAIKVKNTLILQEGGFKISDGYRHKKNGDIKYTNSTIQDIVKNERINRKMVIDYFKQDKSLLTGLYAALIWGGISSGGYTGDNLSKVLNSNQDELSKILKSLEQLIKAHKFKEAYLYMSFNGDGKIKGIGPSYFTKIFFFLGALNEQTIVPPIFDKWTNIAYCALKIQDQKIDFLKTYYSSIKNTRLRSKTAAELYEWFTLDLNRWANNSNISLNELEQYLFGTDKRRDKTDKNPRYYFEKTIKEYVKLNP